MPEVNDYPRDLYHPVEGVVTVDNKAQEETYKSRGYSRSRQVLSEADEIRKLIGEYEAQVVSLKAQLLKINEQTLKELPKPVAAQTLQSPEKKVTVMEVRPQEPGILDVAQGRMDVDNEANAELSEAVTEVSVALKEAEELKVDALFEAAKNKHKHRG